MFVLTDGKNFVSENPLKPGEYIQSTSPNHAKEFTYKQARNLIQNKKKGLAWIREFHMVNKETGKIEKEAKYKKSNGGCFIGDRNFDFNEGIIDLIYEETQSIIGLAGWSSNQIATYKEALINGLSKYDNAESDIKHALQKYKEDNNGKKPQAHKMAKLGYLLDEIRDKHKHIKQCLNYIRVMEDAITNGYTIEKIKLELVKAQHVEYKGRTEYYKIALELLK